MCVVFSQGPTNARLKKQVWPLATSLYQSRCSRRSGARLKAQHRTADELAADAIRQYLKEQSWAQFVARNERRAKDMGITEGDVDRLIAEHRGEKRDEFGRKVEVEEQLQRAIFPRIWSAAYSSAASMSSVVSQGKSLRISDHGAPAASRPRTSATVVRVPRMMGRPEGIAGLMAIRLLASGVTSKF